MHQISTEADSTDIQQVAGQDTESQGQAVKQKLGIRIIGGNVEHIRPTVPRCKQVDQRGNEAGRQKDRNRADKTHAAGVRAPGQPEKASNHNQKQMPQVAVQGQGPVNVGKSIRHHERGDSAKQTVILHKGTQRKPYLPVLQKWNQQAQIHRQTAELEGEKPPVIMTAVDDNI